jgi:hypothetical protein
VWVLLKLHCLSNCCSFLSSHLCTVYFAVSFKVAVVWFWSTMIIQNSPLFTFLTAAVNIENFGKYLRYLFSFSILWLYQIPCSYGVYCQHWVCWYHMHHYCICSYQTVNIHQVYQPMLLSHHCLHLLALLCTFYSVHGEWSAPFEPRRLVLSCYSF